MDNKKWLQRQRRDKYTLLAKKKDLLARSAFKLDQINKSYKIINRARVVVDLGAAPGAWSNLVNDIISKKKDYFILAIDLLPIIANHGITCLVGDAKDPVLYEKLPKQVVNNTDLLLSDMMPNTIGVKSLDSLRLTSLLEEVYPLATKYLLKKNSSILFKLRQSASAEEFIQVISKDFEKLKRIKPEASRQVSSEFYLLGINYISK